MLTRLAFAVVTAIALVGCGAKELPKPKLVPASGRVEYKGKPVANATLQFSPIGIDLAESSMAQLDAEGKFTLASPNFGPGATPGKYKVVITFYGGKGPIPEKYQDSATTPLTVEVPEAGKADFVLTLTD